MNDIFFGIWFVIQSLFTRDWAHQPKIVSGCLSSSSSSQPYSSISGILLAVNGACMASPKKNSSSISLSRYFISFALRLFQCRSQEKCQSFESGGVACFLILLISASTLTLTRCSTNSSQVEVLLSSRLESSPGDPLYSTTDSFLANRRPSKKKEAAAAQSQSIVLSLSKLGGWISARLFSATRLGLRYPLFAFQMALAYCRYS